MHISKVKGMSRKEQLKKNKRKILAVSVIMVTMIGLFGVMVADGLHITTQTVDIEAGGEVYYYIPENIEGVIVFTVDAYVDGLFYRFGPEDPLGIGNHHVGFVDNRYVIFNVENTTYIKFSSYHVNGSLTFSLWHQYELFGWI